MPNTYSQINIHAVFAIFNRENIIQKHWREHLHKYVSGILSNTADYPLAVGGWKDHLHVFFEMKASQNVSSILKEVKRQSSVWINDNKFVKGNFSWQEGFGAFSNSRSQRNMVINYIMNQEEHHRKKTFREEYLEFLKAHEITFNEKYLFKFFE